MIQENNQITPILLVDDDEDWRLLLRDALETSEVCGPIYEVATVRDALAFAKNEAPFESMPRPALIYLDLEMPDGHGVDLLRALKSDVSTHNIPVVAMTSCDYGNQEQAMRGAGAANFYVKSLDLDDVIDTIRRIMPKAAEEFSQAETCSAA